MDFRSARANKSKILKYKQLHSITKRVSFLGYTYKDVPVNLFF